MFNKLMGLGIAAATFAASGCTTTSHRGSVAMKVSETEAHVGLGGGEVKEGDHVELFKNICSDATVTGGSRADGGTTLRSCRKERIGHGNVAKVLGDDYSLVKFPDGTEFSEGDIIEKHSH